MKFWKNLAQVFFGVFAGYWIVQVMKTITFFSGILLIAQGLSGGGGSFWGSIMSWGLLLFGAVVALAIGIVSNFLLIVFLPISGFVSSFISAVMTLWFIAPYILPFFFR